MSTITVGIPGDYRPFAMREAEGLCGFDVDLLRALAREIGCGVRFVETDWPAQLSALERGDFDVAAGGVTRTEERARRALLLPDYAPFTKAAIVRREEIDRFPHIDSMNRPDVRVIRNPGGTNESWVLKHLPRARLEVDPENAGIPGRIAAGEGDLMVTDLSEARWYAAHDPRLAVARTLEPMSETLFKVVMVRRELRGLHAALLEAWQSLDRSSALENLLLRWTRH